MQMTRTPRSPRRTRDEILPTRPRLPCGLVYRYPDQSACLDIVGQGFRARVYRPGSKHTWSALLLGTTTMARGLGSLEDAVAWCVEHWESQRWRLAPASLRTTGGAA